MKTIISLLIAISLVFAISSCSKKDDPQPSTLPTGGTGGTGGTTTISKTIQFYQKTTLVNKYAELYLSKDQSNLVKLSGLNNFKRTKNSACIEPNNSGFPVILNTTGRYFYKITTGNAGSGYVSTFEGYLDVDAAGNITLTQTLGTDLLYENCTTSSFTVNY